MMKMRSLRIDDFTWKQVDIIAKKIKQTKSQFVRTAILEKIIRIERATKNAKNWRTKKKTV